MTSRTQAHAPRAETMERVLDAFDGGPLAWLSAHGFDPSSLRRRLVV